MMRHLLRLVWNRKRQNFLLSVEILCAYFVLVAVVVLGLHFWSNARQPIGFDRSDVWQLSVDTGEPASDPEVKRRHLETMQLISAALRDMPEVEAHGVAWTSAYSNASWESDFRLADGRMFDYAGNRGSDGLRDVLRIEMVAGRWFSREDNGAAWEPVVINERFANAMFGEARAAVGQPIRMQREDGPPRPGDPPSRERRVVGVMQAFRQHGEYATPGHYMFHRVRLDAPPAELADLDLPRAFLLRMQPGTTASFEAPLVRRLQQVADSWTFSVTDLERMRTSKLRQYTMPLAIVGTVAGFLLAMVALGLTGVVWQNVTQRTREFGLRRAKGASAPAVRRQVLFELGLMTSLAVGFGVLVVAQVPLLPLPPELLVVDPGVFVGGIVVSAAAIYLVTMVCGLYPSRLATRIPPAEALHYE